MPSESATRLGGSVMGLGLHGWLLSGVLLFVCTFGVKVCICVLLSIPSILLGFLVYLRWTGVQGVAPHMGAGWPNSICIRKVLSSSPPPSGSASTSSQRSPVSTGSRVIDGPLQELVSLVVRDFVEAWYKGQISEDDAFLAEVNAALATVANRLADRCHQLDMEALLTQTLVSDVVNHARTFRKMEASPEDLRLAGETGQKELVSDLSQTLLFALLPKTEFDCLPLRILLTSVLTERVLWPVVELVADPDFVNQTVCWMGDPRVLNPEWFLSVVRHASSLEELEAVLARLDAEQALLNSHDSISDSTSRSRLQSVAFARRQVEGTMSALRASPLVLERVFEDSLSLDLLLEFLSSRHCEQLGYFVLSADAFRRTAEELPTDAHAQLRDAAKGMLRQYSSLPVRQSTLDSTARKLDAAVTPNVFEELRNEVLALLRVQYLVPFLQQYGSRLPHCPPPEMADELPDEEESATREDGLTYEAAVDSFEVRHAEDGPFAIYVLRVALIQAGKRIRQWTVQRRYRDFDELHGASKARGGPALSFPAKRLNSTSLTVMEERKKALHRFMQALLNAAAGDPRVMELLASFLEPGEWHHGPRPDEMPEGLLLLFDELFELRALRRRLLLHLLRPLLGDALERRLRDLVRQYCSEDSVAEAVRSLIRRLWPRGEWTPGGPVSDRNTRLTFKLLAKVMLLSHAAASMRPLLGTEATRHGVLRAHALFQQKEPNRRLVLGAILRLAQALMPHIRVDTLIRVAPPDTKTATTA